VPKIPLGDVRGRIDHLAVDLKRNRLFVAELGNDTVGVVDLNEQKVQHVITGLKEPQGIGYVPSSDTLFVANAGDGSVLMFHGADYAAAGRIDFGDDADNIRVDSVSNRVFVGYGSGALAVIDPATNGKIADISLQAHPESFQLARSDRRIFVNVPKGREIAVVDGLPANRQRVGPSTMAAIFQWPWTKVPAGFLWGCGVLLSLVCSPCGTAAPLRPSRRVVIRTISSSMRSASACTSAAATDTWMCSRRKRTPTAAQPICRPYPAHELRCLFPNLTDFSSPLAPIRANRPPSGYFAQHRKCNLHNSDQAWALRK
jgi:hypothetical protein